MLGCNFRRNISPEVMANLHMKPTLCFGDVHICVSEQAEEVTVVAPFYRRAGGSSCIPLLEVAELDWKQASPLFPTEPGALPTVSFFIAQGR